MDKISVFLVLVLLIGKVSAAPIMELTITGGEFVSAGSGGSINPAAFASMSVDGSYDGSAPLAIGTEASYFSTSIATYEFGVFGPVAIYTAESGGINGPFPGVTGELTGTNLVLDLSSWTAYWNGTSFNQGSDNVMSTVDENGNFTATWITLIDNGPNISTSANWTITGYVTAVPVPGALWFFCSGLLALVSIKWRTKPN